MEAATFALPRSGPDALYLATRSMGPDDIVLSLHDFTGACPCTGFEASELPIDIRVSDFQSWRGLDGGRSFTQRSIQVNGRSIDVWVEFGGDPAPEALRTEVNTILASLQVAASAGAPTQPDADTRKPPTFEPAEVWNAVSTGPVPVGSEGLSVTWASNVPFHAQDLRDSAQVGQLVFTPRETMRALQPDGVVLVTASKGLRPRSGACAPRRFIPFSCLWAVVVAQTVVPAAARTTDRLRPKNIRVMRINGEDAQPPALPPALRPLDTDALDCGLPPCSSDGRRRMPITESPMSRTLSSTPCKAD